MPILCGISFDMLHPCYPCIFFLFTFLGVLSYEGQVAIYD